MDAATASTKVLYTARTHTTGGRGRGHAVSSDGRLDVRFSRPGAPGDGTNPEQMFAAGWSACFEGALEVVARRMGVELPAETAMDAEVDLCERDGGYFIQARLDVSLPGMERTAGQALIEAADKVCPYSKAVRGNIDVSLRLV